jgi:esterase/lipase superfamily enzyme
VILAGNGRRRPAFLRMGLGLTAAMVCGLLVAACSEAPKIGKAPDSQPPPVEEKSEAAPPPVAAPAPEASTPAKPAPQAEVAAPDNDQQTESDGKEESEKHSYHYNKAAPGMGSQPSAPEASQPSEPELGASGPAAPEAPQDKPAAVGEGAPSAQPEMPSNGAAPPPQAEVPSGGAAPPPPPEPDITSRSLDEEVAPPPPPPVAAAPVVPPPAAPSVAARAAIDNDPSKKFKIVPVFYGTDRAIEPDPARLQFGSERGHKLQLGRALISVPLSHQVPHIERPRIFEVPYFKYKIYEEKEDPNKHFMMQEITSLTEEQMLALVKERLAQSSTFKDHAFVFVHGFNTSFDCALYRTAQIAYDLGFDGVPFVYSWPSGGAVASYTYDHGSVEQAEPMLADFLKLVIQKSGAKNISLIAHSMGNELLLRVLERLKPKIPKGVVISQVILAAPDVDRDKFNIIAREITNFSKGVTLYAASNDRALGYSARFWGGVPRAGDIPKDGPLIIPGVDTIDVTAVSTDALGLNHSGYAENPALLDDVKALVEFGIRPPNQRVKNILTVESAAGTFWRFQATN